MGLQEREPQPRESSISLPLRLEGGASLPTSGTQEGPLLAVSQQFLTGKWPQGSPGINYWEVIPEEATDIETVWLPMLRK